MSEARERIIRPGEPARTIHFVGSYPATSAAAAMREMFDTARHCARPPRRDGARLPRRRAGERAGGASITGNVRNAEHSVAPRVRRGTAIIQLEATFELVAVAMAERAHARYPALADRFARSIGRLAAHSPAGTRFGVHLCYGALHNKAALRPRSTAPLVALANAITAYWPVRRELVYLHGPIAAGEWPPPLDKTYYRPLRDLSLPHHTAFLAGLAHEDQTARDQFRARELLESAVGRPVTGIATACGLAPRSIEAARRAARRMVELTGAG